MTTSERRSTGERGLKQMPDGRWRASWWYEGQWVRRVFPNKTQARQALDAVRGQIVEGRYVNKKKEVTTTFEEAVKRFLAWSESNTRPANAALDRHCSKSWLSFPHFARKKLDKITAGDADLYKNHLMANHRIKNGTRYTGEKLTPRSVDIHVSRLKRMFNLCMEWGLCTSNPAAKVKLLKRDNKRIKYLSEEEEARLMEVCTPELARVVQFALHTGMRRGEIQGLKWSDIDFKTGVAVIPGTRAKGKRERVIPLNSVAVGILQSLPRPMDREALVFGNREGGVWDRVRKHWAKAIALSGLEDFHFHDLRHTYASRLVMSGVDLAVIRELLGHRDFETTLRYAHLSPARLKAAVSLLVNRQPDSHFTNISPQPTKKASGEA